MSLLSLLIALFSEKSLTSKAWQFDFYYQKYNDFFSKNFTAQQGNIASAVFVLLPVFAVLLILQLLDNALIELILSTLILIVCIGCSNTRSSFKEYLHAAFRGETTTSDLFHQQLLTDKNLPTMGFGQALIWLNYRYYIAIILFFVVFGAAGAVLYRLLTSVVENKTAQCIIKASQEKTSQENTEVDADDSITSEVIGDEQNESATSHVAPNLADGCQNHHDVLFWLDWLPVRITSFGYMFVGDFSKAMPVWLESLSDNNKPTYQVLTDVAEQSEDIMVDEEDCTAEPCLLVRLAKRNVLLLLAVISILTLTGFIH